MRQLDYARIIDPFIVYQHDKLSKDDNQHGARNAVHCGQAQCMDAYSPSLGISQYVPRVPCNDSEEYCRELALANVTTTVYLIKLHMSIGWTVLTTSQTACGQLFIPT